MKQNIIFGILSVFCLTGFSLLNRSISNDWQQASKSVFSEIRSKINVTDSLMFTKLFESRESGPYARLDSLYNKGFDYIYIIEEFDINNKVTTRTEKYFSITSPTFERYYSTETNSEDSIQTPNYIFKSDKLYESNNCFDPFNKDKLEAIKSYWEKLEKLTYVIPIVEDTIVTPGCSGTARAVRQREKELSRKFSKPISSQKYRIETLINKNEIKVSFQVPGKAMPLIHIIATTF